MARATGGQARKKKGDAGAAKNYIVGLGGGVGPILAAHKLTSATTDSYPSYQEATMLHVRFSKALYS